MRAIALEKFGSVDNFVLQDWNAPLPKAGEICIKTKATAFNPVDYKVRLGRFGGNLPLILGHEVAGVIDSIGPNVSRFKVGDEVVAYLAGPQSNGSYAEYVAVPHEFAAIKPQTLSWQEAAAVTLVGLTAYEMVVLKSQIKENTSVFVAGGAGGVGSMVIQLARYCGTDQIFTTAGNDQAKQYLINELKIKPDNIINYRGLSVDELTKQVIARNHGKFFPATFDLVGGDMKRLCCEIVDFGGHIGSIVEEPDEFEFNIFSGRSSPLFQRSASFDFTFLGARSMFGAPGTWNFYQQHLPKLMHLFETKQLKAPKITELGDFAVETVQKAHYLLENSLVQGKLVMAFE